MRVREFEAESSGGAEGCEHGGWSPVFSRGFKAPRAHAQVAGHWCLGPLVDGRFFLVLCGEFLD